jgi:hypothetical protein
MKYISAQPATMYYLWQVEVMIHNFLSVGIAAQDIHIVLGHKNGVPSEWVKLVNSVPGVKFFFYRDERKDAHYVSSLRPHILEQHWKRYPDLENETVFYHDCDIAFTRPVDLKDLMEDQVNYVSDTISYVGARYIRSKGEHYLDLMTSIVGVDKQKVIEQEHNSGGAQYLLKQLPTSFWKKVYLDSEKLYKEVSSLQGGNPSEPLQIWCADMWAVLWNLWYLDREVRIAPELSFCWATSPIEQWDRHSIFHNAGVTGKGPLFYKAAFMSQLPYQHIDLKQLSPSHCSYRYADLVSRTPSCFIRS